MSRLKWLLGIGVGVGVGWVIGHRSVRESMVSDMTVEQPTDPVSIAVDGEMPEKPSDDESFMPFQNPQIDDELPNATVDEWREMFFEGVGSDMVSVGMDSADDGSWPGEIPSLFGGVPNESLDIEGETMDAMRDIVAEFVRAAAPHLSEEQVQVQVDEIMDESK